MQDDATIKISIENQTLTVIAKKGERGEDGEDADEEEIIERILPVVLEKVPTAEDVAKLIPTPENGKDGLDGKDGIDAVGEKGEKGEDGKDGSPDTAQQVKDKLLSVGIKYDEIQDTPDIPQIVRTLSSKTTSLSELDDVNLDGLTQTDGKYNLGSGGGGIESIVAGDNVTVDDTDPENPIISASGGDRYKTTSTTSHTIASTGTLTFTVDAGLSYIPNQDVIVAYDYTNYMNGHVVSYSGTTLVVEIKHKSGSGTYSLWEINLDGVPIEAITGATDSTLTKTGTTLGVNLDNDNNWTSTQTFEKVGIGTTAPEASKLHVKESAYAYTTLTGTIVSASVSVFDVNITGSGTLFLTELKKGDILVHPTFSYAKVIITRVTSDTACSGISNGYVSGTYNTSGWRKIVATEISEDADGRRYSATNTKITSPLTGAEIVPTHLIEGDVLFQNYLSPNFGLYIRTSAGDGRMRIGHMNSVAYIQFQHGNANITIDGANFQNCYWNAPLYLGGGNSSNQTQLFINRSGTGANQTMYLQTYRFAVNNDAPLLQLSANGIDIGRRDGSTWYEGIDQITLSMDKTTGNWQVGDFGTTTPTGVASRFSITDTSPNQFRIRYDGLNEFTVTVDSTGKVTLNAVGSGAGFEFSDAVTAPSINGVALTTGGSATKYLSEDGTYTTPSGGGGMTQAQVLVRTLGA